MWIQVLKSLASHLYSRIYIFRLVGDFSCMNQSTHMYFYILIPRFYTCLLLLCNLTSFNELMRFWWFSCWYSTSVSYPLNEYSRFLMWWKLLSLWLKTFIGAILPHWNFQLNLKERFKSFSTQMRNLWISKLVSIAYSYRIVGVYRFLIRRFFDL